ncbi:MAG: hypothetical protein EAZ89_02475, partial [Bacteroidetes bacterium]
MIAYLITSALLSWLGLLLYLGAGRRWLNVAQQRIFIHLTIAASLALPLVVSLPASLQQANPELKPLAFGQPIAHSALQQYCRCERPDYSHRIRYRANVAYNLLLERKELMAGTVFGAMGLVALWLMLQLLYLRWLVRSSQVRPFDWQDIHCLLLYPRRPMPAGAFWLGKPYIIWSESLDQLAENERLAVIRHEWSHLRQMNTSERFALLMIQCLWLLNPAFYYFRKQLSLLSEYIADAQGADAMGSKKAYAQMLLRLKEGQSLPAISRFSGGSLGLRIRRLLHKAEPRQALWPMLLSCLLLLTAQGLTVAPLSSRVSQSLENLRS